MRLCSNEPVFTKTGSEPTGNSLPIPDLSSLGQLPFTIPIVWADGIYFAVAPSPLSGLWKEQSTSSFSSPQANGFPEATCTGPKESLHSSFAVMDSPDQVYGKH